VVAAVAVNTSAVVAVLEDFVLEQDLLLLQALLLELL
jgi:hypothetical protein